MASTSDRVEGIFPKKHADAAAIGLIPIACHLSTVLSGKLLIVGSYSLYIVGMAPCFPLFRNVMRMEVMSVRSCCAEPMICEQ